MSDVTLAKRARKFGDLCELCSPDREGSHPGVLTVANVRLCENHALTLCLIVAAAEK